MYAGHFAPVPALKKLYPETQTSVLAIGVVFLDVAFGVLSLLGLEGFELDSHAGSLGAKIHCAYSHSLLGSIALSLLYGYLTGSFIPGFLASVSHFFVDWMVHNNDLFLDPLSKIVVGGTGLWGDYPTFSFYFEIMFILLCTLLSRRDKPSTITGAFVIFLHVSSSSILTKVLEKVLLSSETYKGVFTCLLINSSFILPAFAITYIMKDEKTKRNQ